MSILHPFSTLLAFFNPHLPLIDLHPDASSSTLLSCDRRRTPMTAAALALRSFVIEPDSPRFSHLQTLLLTSSGSSADYTRTHIDFDCCPWTQHGLRLAAYAVFSSIRTSIHQLRKHTGITNTARNQPYSIKSTSYDLLSHNKHLLS
jgi:hypothetical protein